MQMRHTLLSTGRLTLLAAAMVFLWAGSASGAVITVNTTVDTQDANLSDNICADALGMCSLRAAISTANSTTTIADIINLTPGTYTLTLGGAPENANASGDLDINGPLTINGAGTLNTIIQGGVAINTATERVFDISTIEEVRINTATIQYGYERSTTLFRGGCVRASANVVNLFIEGMRFKDCSADGGGGAISIEGTGAGTSAVSISNSTFDGNRSNGTITGGGGGAIFSNTPLNLTVSNSTFSNNVATSTTGNALGGALYFNMSTGGSFLSITNSTFSGNSATTNAPGAIGIGGAIYNSGTNLTLNLSNVSNNIALWSAVANIGNQVPSNMTISYSTIIGNTAVGNGTSVGHGGGVYATSGGNADVATNIINSLIKDNTTSANGYAGGIEQGRTGQGNATLNVLNSTITGNSAPFGAGGVYLSGGMGNFDFCDVIGNSTNGNGGGIYVQFPAIGSLAANVVTGNTAGGQGPQLFSFNNGVVTSRGRNFILSTSGSNLIPQPTDIIGGDPGIGSFGSFGGPTNTFSRNANSQLIDRIQADFVPRWFYDLVPFAGRPEENGCGSTVKIDQRGFIRPAGSGCDIGAVEVNAVAPTPTPTVTPSPTPTPTPTPTPSLTPTPTPTQSPTPSPTASPTPAPTPSPSPSASPVPAREGDINAANGPNGTGDGDVTIADVIMYGRVARGEVCPTQGDPAFQQKLDAGPRTTFGDGLFGASDGSAIDAYARHDNTTDGNPATPAWDPTPGAGPTTISNLGCARPELVERAETSGPAGPASVLLVPVRIGSELVVYVDIDGSGGEGGTQFTLHFDPSALSISGRSGVNENPDIRLEDDAPAGTTLNVNADHLADGDIALIANFTAEDGRLDAGRRRVASIRFRLGESKRSVMPSFAVTDDVVVRQTVDTVGQDLEAEVSVVDDLLAAYIRGSLTLPFSPKRK